MRENSNMSDDPFSDVLKLTNAQSVISGGFTNGGAWAIRFRPGKIKFFALVKGSCWLQVDGEATPTRLEAGDMFLVARHAFVLASDLATVPGDATRIFAGKAGMITRLADADDILIIGGHVMLDPAGGGLLMDVLPPLIHARAASPQAVALQWLVDQIVSEQMSELPGSSVASSQLAQLMFVQLLRVHLASAGVLAAGLLRAVSDRRIAPALRLMHGEPGRQWQLEELARAAAMSRTTFAVYFKSVAGIAPLAYLTEWRMRLAERALREQNTPVSVLARSLGYASESAFSNAFKRVTGNAPKLYRMAVRAAAQSLEPEAV